MPRRKSCRRVCFNPKIKYFKPRGVAMKDLQIVKLSPEELEAIRLKSIKNLDQTKCAEKMETSQSTFQRILSSAHQKIAEALTEGKAIEITEEQNPVS